MSQLSRLLVLLIFGLVAVGCRSEHVAIERSSQVSAAQKSQSRLASRAKGDAPPGVGRSCVTPKDCPSYLWCFEETCKMPPAATDEHDAQTPRVKFLAGQGGAEATFFAELAITPAEHEKGLMFRRSLPDDWSMLFIYPDEARRSFWMENTFIPLDMIFIAADGQVVNIVREAEPLTRTPRSSTGPARYVLEIRGGRAEELGLKAGQRIALENVADGYKLRAQ